MRILTVRPPWSAAIMHSGKDVENRPRNIAGTYRGPVAIHAGKTFDHEARFPDRTPLPAAVYGTEGGVVRGAIIGVVDLVGIHSSGDCYQDSIQHAAHMYRTDREAFDALPIQNNAGGLIARARYCSEWAQDDAHHMVLENPRPLAEPIPYTGALGLRHLDPETILAIVRQIGRV